MFKELKVQIQAKIPVIAVDIHKADFHFFLRKLSETVCDIEGYQVQHWTLHKGLVDKNNQIVEGTNNPIAVLQHIADNAPQKGAYIYVLDGFCQFLNGPRANAEVQSRFEKLAIALQQFHKTIILLDDGINLPNFLGFFQTLIYSLPDWVEIEGFLAAKFRMELDKFGLDPKTIHLEPKLIRACQGLTMNEIQLVCRLSVFDLKENLNTDTLTEFINEFKLKKLKEMNLEVIQQPSISVGGLKLLKSWLKRRAVAFNHPDKVIQPKGFLTVGVPGCGKSLIASNVGELLGIPVVRLDIGSIYHKLVGESEAQLKRILQTVEACSPMVLWIDELEKAFAGATGTSSDSGVSQRLFGSFLTWMQEKTAPVFVVATANRIDTLPPELLRKGRFDEIFFVDLPNNEERKEILKIHLEKYKVKLKDAQVNQLVEFTLDYSGSELAYLVDESMILALSEGRKVTFDDFLLIRNEITPQADRNPSQINSIRSWADQTAKRAS